MPIKKSNLEQKWYYRGIKVILLILPLLFLLFFLNGKVNICSVTPKNIFDLSQKEIVYIILGLVVYYLALKALWRLFVYVVFGGLEDDTKKQDGNQQASAKPKNANAIIPIIIILVMLLIAVLSEMGYITLPKIHLNSLGDPNVKTAPGPACYATSAQWGTPCHTVKNGIGVTGVIVPDSCGCPTDTKFSQMDNITAGGPYKICVCK